LTYTCTSTCTTRHNQAHPHFFFLGLEILLVVMIQIGSWCFLCCPKLLLGCCK
jgi:hypothetical protein